MIQISGQPHGNQQQNEEVFKFIQHSFVKALEKTLRVNGCEPEEIEKVTKRFTPNQPT